MTWSADRYWVQASEAALRAAGEADLVFVPQEFVELHPRFVPLEFSWGLDARGGRRLAFCVSKDDAHRLAPALLRCVPPQPAHYAWANEVFVLGSTAPWRRPGDDTVHTHLGLWFERLGYQARGVAARAPNWRAAVRPAGLLAPRNAGRRVLVVGASGMGNVGDDLLAQVLAEELFHAGAAEVWLSGPDIDPLHLGRVDAVVVGGGGLVYAGREGVNEWQNLGNYLRLGPMAARAGLPCALVGVGDQDHDLALTCSALPREFAAGCLKDFMAVTTRDEQSAALLRALGAREVRAGSDLLYAWAERVQRAPRPTRVGSPRIGLSGELFKHPALQALLQDGPALAAAVAECDYDLLVMSEDDLPHVQRARALLRAAGAGVSVVDGRGRSIETLSYVLGAWHGMVTTRFHGLVLASMAGLPVLALDVADGKKARLLGERAASEALLLTPDAPPALARHRLEQALAGRLDTFPAALLQPLVACTQVHRDAVRRLLDDTGRRGNHAGGATLPMNAVSVVTPSPARARPARPDLVSPRDEDGAVGLCWAASTPQTQGFGNLGDSLSAVMVSALSGLPVRHVNFDEKRTKLVAVGSIGHAIRHGEAVVWGCGVSVRGTALVENVPQTRYDVRAIRGPISAGHYRALGIEVPEVYGDPVWLLPSIFNEPIEKKYELGVIPHIQDVDGYGPDARARAESARYVVDEADAGAVTLINTWHEPTWEGLLATLRRMLQCKRILSQSFHGVVIAEAYGIPALNFRQMPGVAAAGALRIDLDEPCATDPRIFEFFQGGRRRYFDMYAQRRTERSDWEDVIRTIDRVWEPFEYDATALVESFPLPLAYDPLRGRPRSHEHLAALRF